MASNSSISDMRYATDYRFAHARKYEWREQSPYDYRSQGIISKVAPAFLLQSNNPLLTRLMRFIDMQSITMLMCVDKVKHFKNYLNK